MQPYRNIGVALIAISSIADIVALMTLRWWVPIVVVSTTIMTLGVILLVYGEVLRMRKTR